MDEKRGLKMFRNVNSAPASFTICDDLVRLLSFRPMKQKQLGDDVEIAADDGWEDE